MPLSCAHCLSPPRTNRRSIIFHGFCAFILQELPGPTRIDVLRVTTRSNANALTMSASAGAFSTVFDSIVRIQDYERLKAAKAAAVAKGAAGAAARPVPTSFNHYDEQNTNFWAEKGVPLNAAAGLVSKGAPVSLNVAALSAVASGVKGAAAAAPAAAKTASGAGAATTDAHGTATAPWVIIVPKSASLLTAANARVFFEKGEYVPAAKCAPVQTPYAFTRRKVCIGAC